MIRISPIRVVGPDNEQIGVIETQDAIRMAQEQGLDLVEVVADSRPPVCKIMDYGKYRYELTKKEGKSKGQSQELKEIRLGRSVKIGSHDVEIRVNQARRFLMAGHKVQFTQRFKGREMMHKELGIERLADIVEALSDIAKVELAPRWMGRQASIVLAPDRNKVETAKRKIEAEKAEKARRGEKVEEDPDLEELESLVSAQNLADEGDDDDDDGVNETGADQIGGDAAGQTEPKLKRAAKAKEAKEAKEEDKKKKGPKDQRARNPIDDELASLLGDDA